jgi:3-deoxy-7-phosphoheptulonate synthase
LCALVGQRRQPSSEKLHQRQIEVAQDVAAQITAGTHCVFGVMVERRWHAGA